ncbi:DUF2490 domain-containing protein [Mucilaginibacter segetis]|uniref:DUF2490 domain-containing protein n=1 Tax=Mucilaginibacter segetis TaxID=2793071 RepID=A0A934UP16_9SPHI|nr:DUF2490 domain-containing protein [Mucilaginibacter segetis]MBK0380512.1 DUF2490 domain-containing protein [Mucilaginibacter segetis]
MNKKPLLLLVITFLLPIIASAQENQFSGWAAYFYSQKVSPKWGVAFDGQLRTANHYDYVNTVLLRPSVNYFFSKNTSAALGYAYVASYGRAGGEKTFRPENRTWEQFIVSHPISKNIGLAHRFRLEQIYKGNSSAVSNDHYFSQRLRYFARSVIPFKAEENFVKGAFVALQNEVFVNVQNKNKTNTHFFDQNWAYVALGYRISKGIDAEFGYLNQYLKQAETHTVNHILQAAFYTRF